MSAYIREALELRAWARADFEDYRLAEYERASEACRGALLNERGRRAGIDSLSLFMGSSVRAYAYASDELKEHWQTHKRPVFAEFELQHLSAHRYA